MSFYVPVTAPAPVQSRVEPAPVRTVPFEFTGNANEYFRIWIVNTLLTIVTLGVYSAWAKVRTKRYFYRNTKVDGSSFDYLADPIPILKGRIIAALALGLLFGSQYYSLPLYVGLLIVYLLLTPWVVVKALAFNARNSAYRNVRFVFTGRPGEAAGLYLGMMLLQIATCGIATPYVQWRMTGFVVTRHLYGDLRLQWESKPMAYFRAYLIAIAMLLLLYVVFLVTLVAVGSSGAFEAASVIVPLMSVHGSRVARAGRVPPGAARQSALRGDSYRAARPLVQPALGRAAQDLLRESARDRVHRGARDPVGEGSARRLSSELPDTANHG